MLFMQLKYFKSSGKAILFRQKKNYSLFQIKLRVKAPSVQEKPLSATAKTQKIITGHGRITCLRFTGKGPNRAAYISFFQTVACDAVKQCPFTHKRDRAGCKAKVDGRMDCHMVRTATLKGAINIYLSDWHQLSL